MGFYRSCKLLSKTCEFENFAFFFPKEKKQKLGQIAAIWWWSHYLCQKAAIFAKVNPLWQKTIVSS